MIPLSIKIQLLIKGYAVNARCRSKGILVTSLVTKIPPRDGFESCTQMLRYNGRSNDIVSLTFPACCSPVQI